MAHLAIKSSQLGLLEEGAAEMLYIVESVSLTTANMLWQELIHCTGNTGYHWQSNKDEDLPQ